MSGPLFSWPIWITLHGLVYALLLAIDWFLWPNNFWHGSAITTPLLWVTPLVWVPITKRYFYR